MLLYYAVCVSPAILSTEYRLNLEKRKTLHAGRRKETDACLKRSTALRYSVQISQDPGLRGTVVRNSTIPEELGRIDYLLTDKTGALPRASDSCHSSHRRSSHLGSVVKVSDRASE